MKIISHSYWRSVKRGTRTFDSIRDEEIRADIRILAQSDVTNGAITATEYQQYLGEAYPEEDL